MAGSTAQVTPSVVAKIPLPWMASPFPNPSPVPAYIVLGSAGLIAMHAQARLPRKSSTAAQVAPPFWVCHTPPPAAAAHIRLGVPGSMTMPLTLPPILPGPSHFQAASVSPASPGAAGAAVAVAAAAGPVGTPAVCAGGSVTAAT